MADAVTGNVIQCVGFRDIFCGLADNNAQFDFPVGLFRATWNNDVIVRTDDSRGGLHKDDWLGRNRCASFRSMVREVETDADELARASDAGTNTAVIENRQAGQVQCGNLFQAFRRNRLTANIFYMGRKVADLTVIIQNGWLFLTRWANTHQFHRNPPGCQTR
ncbi:hypothetical protein D3C80_1531040 [compost metagenome]